METALAIVGWPMVAATVLPLARSEVWVVRVFDFPRLQITVIFAATFALYLSFREEAAEDKIILAT